MASMNLNANLFVPSSNGANGNSMTSTPTTNVPTIGSQLNLSTGINLNMPNLNMPTLPNTTTPKNAPSIPLMPVILTPNDAIRALANSLPVTNTMNMNASPQNPNASPQNPTIATAVNPTTNALNTVNALNALGGISLKGTHAASDSNLMSLLNATKNLAASNNNDNKSPSAAEQEAAELRQELSKERNKMQLIQTAYWSLRADFDNVCDVIKSMENNKTASMAMANNANTIGKPGKKGSKLNTITEGESLDIKEELQKKIKEQDQEIARLEVERDGQVHLLQVQIEQMEKDHEATKKAHQKAVDALKKKNKESNKKVNTLEKDIKNLKHKIKKCEKENKKLVTVHAQECTKKTIKKDLLGELYLNSSRIKEFMAAIKKYGDQYKTLKKRQTNLTACIGEEDAETLKLRMGDLSKDIVAAEQSYTEIYESLDMMKTESQGKEFEVMTKDREHIELLEKEKFTQSSHLEEYVKKNQTLQLDLTDREMKLRQAQNELNHLKQRITKLETQNSGLMQQNVSVNQMLQSNPHGFAAPQMNMNMNVNMFHGGQPFVQPVFNGGYNVYNQHPQYGQ